jgi:hypothetical protein
MALISSLFELLRLIWEVEMQGINTNKEKKEISLQGTDITGLSGLVYRFKNR